MKKLLLSFVTLIILASFVIATDPRLVAGNPTCEDIGYNDLEFKIDPPTPGNYSLTAGSFTWTTSDGIYFNWTSTIGLDAVMCKGGNQGAYVYDYDPASTGDTGLYCPDNCNKHDVCTGPAGISHITLCYEGGHEIPEFTTIGAALVLAGAGLFIYRKRSRK